MRFLIFILFFVSFNLSAIAESPLSPVRLENPRDTMRSFMIAMEDYKSGLNQNNEKLKSRLDDAVRTLDLSDFPSIIRKEKGREVAILLKEVLDRVIIVNYELIPDDPDRKLPWRIKDTEIKIYKKETGEHQGEFLFSKETVQRAKDFYDKVKDLPYLPGSTEGADYVAPWNERMIPHWAKGTLLGLQRWQWLGIFLAIIFGFIGKFLTTGFVGSIKKIVRGKEDSHVRLFINAIEKPSGLFVASLLWLLAVQLLQFKGLPLQILSFTIQVLLSISLIWAVYRMCDLVSAYFQGIAQTTESKLDDQLVPIVTKSLRIFVILMGSLVTIDNLGFDVMSLLAGLGLGGLAFALAAKDTVANLFGSMVILLDRPFRIGDLIISDGVEGTVTQIGFRSTRIKTLYDSVISVPNSKLATDTIDNMGLRTYRRLRATIGLTYDTPPEKIEAFIESIKNLLTHHPLTRKDNFNVVFHSYNSSSLDILINCFLKVPDWDSELRERQKINLEILRLAKQNKVSFAFPSQSIYVESMPK